MPRGGEGKSGCGCGDTGYEDGRGVLREVWECPGCHEREAVRERSVLEGMVKRCCIKGAKKNRVDGDSRPQSDRDSEYDASLHPSGLALQHGTEQNNPFPPCTALTAVY